MTREGPGHDAWADAAGAYLLEALTDDERTAFEAHVSECPACRDEIDELRIAADALPVSAPPLTPPPELKARIMAVVEAEAQLLEAAGERRDAAAPARERRGWWDRLRSITLSAPVAVAASLALLLAGIGGGVLIGGGDGAPETRQLAAQVDQTAAPGARVSLQIDEEGRASLSATGMPQAPAGRVWQVWKQRPGQDPEPTNALFSTRADGSASASVPGSLDGVEAVLVTAEPRAGSDAPTRKPILAVDV